MDSDVMCCETKTGLDGWSEVCGCLVSTNYKEPPLVIIEDEWTQVNSNGGHVIPTISAVEYKGVQKQKDTGGVYLMLLHEKEHIRSTLNCTTKDMSSADAYPQNERTTGLCIKEKK